MKTINVKIDSLTGPALRYALAVCLGYKIEQANDKGRLRVVRKDSLLMGSFMADGSAVPAYLLPWHPDVCWSQFGELADRFGVDVWAHGSDSFMAQIKHRTPLTMIGNKRLLTGCRLLVFYLHNLFNSEQSDTFEVPAYLYERVAKC